MVSPRRPSRKGKPCSPGVVIMAVDAAAISVVAALSVAWDEAAVSFGGALLSFGLFVGLPMVVVALVVLAILRRYTRISDRWSIWSGLSAGSASALLILSEGGVDLVAGAIAVLPHIAAGLLIEWCEIRAGLR